MHGVLAHVQSREVCFVYIHGAFLPANLLRFACPWCCAGLSAAAAKEAAELEQLRNDVRTFLEDEGEAQKLADQQLTALVDLLAGSKATEHLLSREKEEAAEEAGVDGGDGNGEEVRPAGANR